MRFSPYFYCRAIRTENLAQLPFARGGRGEKSGGRGRRNHRTRDGGSRGRGGKRKAPGDTPGAFDIIAAAPDGQPVSGVKSAAPAGYHYTLGPPPSAKATPLAAGNLATA